MIIRGHTSKKLMGAVCISSISQKAMTANVEFEIDEGKFWAPDVQRALQTKKIVFTSKIPEDKERCVITNISPGSITITGCGVVRSGQSVRVAKEETEKVEIQRMFNIGRVSRSEER